MNAPSRRIVGTAFAGAWILACTSASWGAIATLDVGTPKSTGQESFDIKYKVSGSNVRETLPVTTPEKGENDTPAQAAARGAIMKGQTDDQKAQAIAKDINDAAAAAGKPVSAVAVEGAVVISVPGGTITDVNFSGSNTDEKHKTTYTDLLAAALPQDPVLVATVSLEGAIAGVTMDGDPATVEVGTDRHTATFSTGSYTRLSDLTMDIVHELEAHGVRVLLLSRTQFLILIDEDVDRGLLVGDDDRALKISSSCGML
ncbi:MAG: hypothetical protein HY812_08070 [Planctomycetes bacterium]|nr:hypothetical protein [Planctomycetota bacterium]